MTAHRPGRFAFHSSFVFQPSFRLLCLVALCALLMIGWLTQHASATMAVADNPTPIVTVSAASYEASAVAPDGIVAAFGTQLATATVVGGDSDPNTPGIQLPTSLGGTSVEVGGRLAGLFFVSALQVNYVVPATTPAGAATVIVRSGDGTVSTGTVQVSLVAPAIFTANSNGQGVPAANLVRVKTNGQQSFEALADFDNASGSFRTKSLDLGPTGEVIVLVLYASGVRNAPDPNKDGNANENVRVTIGGTEVPTLYTGKQGDFLGLDQINAIDLLRG